MLKNVPQFDPNNLMKWYQYDTQFVETADPIEIQPTLQERLKKAFMNMAT